MQVLQRRSRLSRLLLSAAVIATCPNISYADVSPRWTDVQLAGFSDVIIRGRVTRVAAGSDPRVHALYTYVTLDVTDVIKGAVRDRSITIKQLGGKLGSSALVIAGQPTFATDEDVIVFLEIRPRDHTLSTTALWQGKFTVTPDGASGGIASRQDPGAIGRGAFSSQTRRLAEWLPLLRREASATGSTTAGEVTVAPAELPTTTLDDGWSRTATGVWYDKSLAHRQVRVDALAAGGPAEAAGSGEPEIRRAADFWTGLGLSTLSTGGLQPRECFTARAPDGRIAIGLDACEELSPRGGTIATSGAVVHVGGDGNAAPSLAFLGGGVLINPGDTAARLLSHSACYERVVTHELGHLVGLIDAPDGSGVMAPTLDCKADAARGSEPHAMLVPLTPGARRGDDADAGTTSSKIMANAVNAAQIDPTQPGAANLGYTLSGSTLTLTWTATNCCFRSFVIRAGSAPGLADVASIELPSPGPIVNSEYSVNPPTTFSAVVGGNAVFYVRVIAAIFHAGDFTPPSNEIAIVVGNATPPPSPPSGLTSSVSGNTVTLGWNGPGAGQPVTSYIIQAGSQPAAVDVANFSTGSTATSYTAAGVPFGTYFVRVRAANGASISAASNEVRLDLVNTCVPPGPPTNLIASLAGSTVTLAWTAGSGATSYQLQAGSRQGAADLADQDLLSSNTSFVAANVSPGTYFVRVRSNNACAQSSSSNEVVVILR